MKEYFRLDFRLPEDLKMLQSLLCRIAEGPISFGEVKKIATGYFPCFTYFYGWNSFFDHYVWDQPTVSITKNKDTPYYSLKFLTRPRPGEKEEGKE